MSYCQDQQLQPRIDSSNLSLSFFRNRLRLQLLPVLRQYNPSVDQALLRLADIAREDSAFIEQQAAGLWDEVARQEDNAIHLDKNQTANLPIALQRQLLRAAVARLVGDTRDVEASHIEAARGLLNKPVGKMLSLPHGLICHGEYDELVMTRSSPVIASTAKQSLLPSSCPFPPLKGEFSLEVPGKTVLPGWNVIASIVRERSDLSHRELFNSYCSDSEPFACCHSARSKESQVAQVKLREGEEPPGALVRLRGSVSADFDWHKTGSELFVRQRRPGDRFQPLGMNMLKKVQEFMVDAKIPRSWRGHIPIVCSPQQIVWVAGWRIDDRVKVTRDSKEILRLEFIKAQ